MYHWVHGGEATIETGFSERALAGERVLDRTSKQSRMIFGLGPARSGEKAERRGRALLLALGPGIKALRWGEQIHGTDIAIIEDSPKDAISKPACVGPCDALITTQPGVGLLVWTADCVPVLLAGPGVVAAIHSGWRGSAADIVGAVLARLESGYGVTPAQVQVALGPAISGPHYQVGLEVIDALEALGLPDRRWREDDRVDLRAFLVGRLRELGVAEDSIDTVGPCTYASPRLASYRRDGGRAGRQFSLVYRRVDGDDPVRDGDLRPRS